MGSAGLRWPRGPRDEGLAARTSAQAAVERLIGVKVDEAAARGAVAAAGQGTGA